MKKLTLTVLLTLVLILTLGTTAGALAQGEGSVTTFINVNGSVRTGERATVTVTLNNAQGQRACSSSVSVKTSRLPSCLAGRKARRHSPRIRSWNSDTAVK